MIFGNIFKKPTYDLCITHYYRGKDEKGRIKPFHRAITIVTNASTQPVRGTVFQVVQVNGKLNRYHQLSDADVTLSQIPERYSGSIKIGEVKGKSDMRLVERILKGVPVEQGKTSSWMGQRWTRDGVRKLATAGFVDRACLLRLNDDLGRMETEYLLCLALNP